MTLTIFEAYALLFPGATNAHAGDAANPLGWFGDEGKLTPRQLSVARVAQQTLLRHVGNHLAAWQDDLDLRCGGTGPRLPTALSHALHLPPRSPYDVFAIAAYLIESAGVYHHIQPSKTTNPAGICDEPHLNRGPQAPAGERHLAISEADRDLVINAGEAWRNIPALFAIRADYMADLLFEITRARWKALAPLFESWLVVFGGFGPSDVFEALPTLSAAPAWWYHVWRLFAIADQAALKTGFQIDTQAIPATMTPETCRDPDGPAWFETLAFMPEVFNVIENADSPEPDTERRFGLSTFSAARQEIVCVLPKVRTPSVGCTLRSLSHHLALLPGRGVARGKWSPNVAQPTGAPSDMPRRQMNMLLIPFPYTVRGGAFCGGTIEDMRDSETRPRFGYFDVHQHWIEESRTRRDELMAYMGKLLEAAHKLNPRINALVFPELAIDDALFDRICEYATAYLSDVELIIAGTSTKRRRHGNFVTVASLAGKTEFPDFNRKPDAYRAPKRLVVNKTVREKHHRWKLDRGQLKDYGLLGYLSPELSWWENIPLLSRRVDFHVLRQSSVIAAMICEDLARVDPCQEAIRAVGPNLVVALLMDAPQRNGRWPARYATVLAEDPGCSVLTLTSRGLMTRQHRLGTYVSDGKDRSIAMWRDDRTSAPIELHCPYDAQAVILSIIEDDAEDLALDGRKDSTARAWHYVGHVPVRIPHVKTEFPDILGEDDLASW